MEYPDPSAITSWPAATVAIAVIICVAVVPSLFAYLNNQNIKQTREEIDATKRAVTEKNGGKSMPDRFDAIDAKLDRQELLVREVSERVTALEDNTRRRSPR